MWVFDTLHAGRKVLIEEHSMLSSTEQKELATGSVKQKDSESREVRSAYMRILNKYGSMRHQSNWFSINRKTMALSKKPNEEVGYQEGICKTGDWCFL